MKKIICILGLLVGYTSLSAQTEFSHSAGVSYILGNYKYFASLAQTLAVGKDESGTYNQSYPCLTYAPRLDFVLSTESSIGLGLYPSAGINIATKQRDGQSGIFAAEIPIVAQFNFGHTATERSRRGFGFYIGGGYNVGYYGGIGVNHGPTAQAGTRFQVSDRSIQIRLFATKPLNLSNNETLMYFGGGILYNLTYQGYKIIK